MNAQVWVTFDHKPTEQEYATVLCALAELGYHTDLADDPNYVTEDDKVWQQSFIK